MIHPPGSTISQQARSTHRSLTSHWPQLMILGQVGVVTRSLMVHLCAYTQTATHTLKGLWACITQTQRPSSPGQAVKEGSLSGCHSLQPITSVHFREMCGVTPQRLTSWVTVLGTEKLTEEGCLAYTCLRTAPGYQLQPLLHLCLHDLPNDVFIYCTTSSQANTDMWNRHTACHTQMAKRGTREAYKVAPIILV